MPSTTNDAIIQRTIAPLNFGGIMGMDPRVASSMLALGYDVFPFDAFDASGRIKVPDRVQYPSYVRDGLGRIAAAPAWVEIYRTLSVLHRAPWSCYMAGVGFQSGTLNIAVFKAASSAPSPAHAHRWSLSYQTTVATSLKAFAGTKYVIDPAWFDVLDTAIEKAKDINDGGKLGLQSDFPIGFTDGDDAPAGSETFQITALNPVDFLLMGLTFVSKFLKTLKLSTEIRTTTVWYASAGVHFDSGFAGLWTPLHTDYRYDSTIRMLHMLWDPNGSPNIRWGANIKWSAWLWRMPHEPWQWCRSFYPMGKCGGPTLVYAGLEGGAEAVAPNTSLELE